MRTRGVLLSAAAVSAVIAAPGDARTASATLTCAQRSMASFPRAYTDRSNLVVGPLAFLGAGAALDPDSGRYEGAWRWKLPVLVRAGHTVTIRVGAGGRRFARITHVPANGWDFTRASERETFRACQRGFNSGSSADGRSVTFWSGGLVARRGRGCVPLEIRIDGKRAVRHRTVAIGDSVCD